MIESKKGNFRPGGANKNRDNRKEGNFKKDQYHPQTPKTGSGGGKPAGLWREEDVGEKNKLKLIA